MISHLRECCLCLLWLTLLLPSSSQLPSFETLYSQACPPFDYQSLPLPTSPLPPVISDAITQVKSILKDALVTLQIPSVSFGIVYDQDLIEYIGLGEIKKGLFVHLKKSIALSLSSRITFGALF